MFFMFRFGLIKGHGFGTTCLGESNPLRDNFIQVEKEITINILEKLNRVSIVK